MILSIIPSFSYNFYSKIQVRTFFLKLITIRIQYFNLNLYGSILKDYDGKLSENKLQNVVKKKIKLLRMIKIRKNVEWLQLIDFKLK